MDESESFSYRIHVCHTNNLVPRSGAALLRPTRQYLHDTSSLWRDYCVGWRFCALCGCPLDHAIRYETWLDTSLCTRYLRLEILARASNSCVTLHAIFAVGILLIFIQDQLVAALGAFVDHFVSSATYEQLTLRANKAGQPKNAFTIIRRP